MESPLISASPSTQAFRDCYGFIGPHTKHHQPALLLLRSAPRSSPDQRIHLVNVRDPRPLCPPPRRASTQPNPVSSLRFDRSTGTKHVTRDRITIRSIPPCADS